MKTQGEIEAAICEGISRFEQEHRGRGPKDIRAYLLGECIYFLCRYFFSNAPISTCGPCGRFTPR